MIKNLFEEETFDIERLKARISSFKQQMEFCSSDIERERWGQRILDSEKMLEKAYAFAAQQSLPEEPAEEFVEIQPVQEPNQPKSITSSPKQTTPKESTYRNFRSESGKCVLKPVDASVVRAIRKVITDDISNPERLAAFVHIHTGGDCELTEKAKRAVKNYEGDKTLTEIKSQLDYLQKAVKQIIASNHVIELGIALNLTDSLYAGIQNRGKDTKNLNICQTTVIDMLDRLRAQSKEQTKVENKQKGRQIYNQTKALDD
jgi:hypothetical protein